MLPREEYVEQAYFFRTLRERSAQNVSTQDLLISMRDEVLATTRLPMALDFLASEIKLHGVLGPAMAKIPHYFAPFQTYLVQATENDKLRFDFPIALAVLEREATYRSQGATPAGVFMYQFETICRNRLGYDRSLDAVAADPIFDETWREWILEVRRKLGIVDFADMVYYRSEHYRNQRRNEGLDEEGEGPKGPVLFGEKEGQIALAHRRKDPLFLFSALERQLGYPTVPRPKPPQREQLNVPALLSRLDRMEARLRLVEEESQQGGINLENFMKRPGVKPVEPVELPPTTGAVEFE